MFRALAAALLVSVVAGCGGTSAESAALRYARSFGAQHPKVVRVERFRLSTGYARNVVLVRGVFCGPNGASTPGATGTVWRDPRGVRPYPG